MRTHHYLPTTRLMAVTLSAGLLLAACGEADGFAKPILEHADQFGYVHIGESHRGNLGTGTIDFDTFFDALAKVGYDGGITFESFSSAVVHPELSNTLGVWRNLCSDSTDLVKWAHRFMVDELERTHQTTVGV